MEAHLRATATAVLDHALAGPARLGRGRLVCVDGPSGSGKTTLAAAVARLASDHGATAHVLHTDDLLEGWGGLPALPRSLHDLVLAPLAAGRPARYRRYDWGSAGFAEEHTVAPMDLLVLDGVGAGHPALRPHRSTLVWVEAEDPALRLERTLARDGDAIRDALLGWHRDEARYFAEHDVRGEADVHVDGSGRLAG